MKKNLTFFITNSYGEIDEASKIIDLTTKDDKINIIFFGNQFKDRYLTDSILKKKTKIKNINIFFPNNFINKIFVSIKLIFLSEKIYTSDDTYRNYSIFFYLICKILLKKRIIFKHTASPYYSRKVIPLPRNFLRDKKTNIIVFNKTDYNFFYKCGYKFIEQKKENKEYDNIIISKINSKIKYEKYVLILSYRIHYILPLIDKISHYKDIFEIIKKKNIKKVYIKPHPAESIKELKRILQYINVGKVEVKISVDNVKFLSNFSLFTIGIITGGALIPFFNKKKSLIFYKNINKYIEYHDVMYDFEPKKSGIHICRTQNELKRIINLFE